MLPIQLPTFGEILAVVEGLYATYGYPIVLLAALLENTVLLGMFFPGGTMVILGGAFARLGDLSLPLVILVGTLGTFLGASLDYWLARRGINIVLRRLKVGSQLDQAFGWLRRYGFWAVLGAHFVGHFRSLVAVAAGLLPVPYRRFALWELPSALAWNTVYATLGYMLADQLHLVEEIGKRIGHGVLVLVALFVAWKAWRWWSERRAKDAPAQQAARRMEIAANE